MEGGDTWGPLRWNRRVASGVFLPHGVEGFGRVEVQLVREQGFGSAAELAIAEEFEGATAVEVFLE